MKKKVLEEDFKNRFLNDHRIVKFDPDDKDDPTPLEEKFYEGIVPEPDTPPPDKPQVRMMLQSLSKMSKTNMRKNSTRRTVEIVEPEKPLPRKFPGAKLPPKPSSKPSKYADKVKLFEKLIEISKKDMKETFKRWAKVQLKIGKDQRFNLMVLQPGKL